jgi:uncharacterized protein YggL (DUF469 family)
MLLEYGLFRDLMLVAGGICIGFGIRWHYDQKRQRITDQFFDDLIDLIHQARALLAEELASEYI